MALVRVHLAGPIPGLDRYLSSELLDQLDDAIANLQAAQAAFTADDSDSTEDALGRVAKQVHALLDKAETYTYVDFEDASVVEPLHGNVRPWIDFVLRMSTAEADRIRDLLDGYNLVAVGNKAYNKFPKKYSDKDYLRKPAMRFVLPPHAVTGMQELD